MPYTTEWVRLDEYAKDTILDWESTFPLELDSVVFAEARDKVRVTAGRTFPTRALAEMVALGNGIKKIYNNREQFPILL